MVGRPWTLAADGILIDVRVTPRGGRDAVGGIEQRADGRAVLRARVRAAPADGEANDALRRLLADALGIAARQVVVAAGAKSRIKRLRIAGDPQALEGKLERLTRAAP